MKGNYQKTDSNMIFIVLDLLCIEHKSLREVKICVLYSKIDGYGCDKDQEHTTAFISCSL